MLVGFNISMSRSKSHSLFFSLQLWSFFDDEEFHPFFSSSPELPRKTLSNTYLRRVLPCPLLIKPDMSTKTIKSQSLRIILNTKHKTKLNIHCQQVSSGLRSFTAPAHLSHYSFFPGHSYSEEMGGCPFAAMHK